MSIIGTLNRRLIFKLQHGCNDSCVVKAVDGSATPLLDSGDIVDMKQASAAGDNFIRFGDISGTTAYQSTVDWLVWTRTGAYTPAELMGKLPAGIGATPGY